MDHSLRTSHFLTSQASLPSMCDITALLPPIPQTHHLGQMGSELLMEQTNRENVYASNHQTLFCPEGVREGPEPPEGTCPELNQVTLNIVPRVEPKYSESKSTLKTTAVTQCCCYFPVPLENTTLCLYKGCEYSGTPKSAREESSLWGLSHLQTLRAQTGLYYRRQVERYLGAFTCKE